MRQQVDVHITLDAAAAQDADLLKEFIKAAFEKHIDPKHAELIQIEIREEAHIYGNDAPC